MILHYLIAINCAFFYYATDDNLFQLSVARDEMEF